jgi:hypothetical protein
MVSININIQINVHVNVDFSDGYSIRWMMEYRCGILGVDLLAVVSLGLISRCFRLVLVGRRGSCPGRCLGGGFGIGIFWGSGNITMKILVRLRPNLIIKMRILILSCS